MNNVRFLWRAIQEGIQGRLAWLRVTRRLHPDTQVSWFARVRGKNISIGRGTQIEAGAFLDAAMKNAAQESITIGRNCIIKQGVMLQSWQGSISIGEHSSINAYGVMQGTGGITIGKDVRIGAHVVIIASQHVYEDASQPIASQGWTAKGITIEDDVWIGANVMIMDGVTIGQGSVIAAGAVVNADVEPFTVAGGVPAKFIKKRGSTSE